MQAVQLITVCAGYQPLAGTGKNTIRKYDGKYFGLQVGDNVVMHYTDDPQTTGASNATELLQVSSIAIAPLDVLLKAHARHNHSKRTLEQIKKIVLSCYPMAVEGEERNPADLYTAIYF